MSRLLDLPALIACFATLAFCGAVHGQQSLVSIEVPPAEKPVVARGAGQQAYIAPELQIARDAKADLVGFDREGKLVVSVSAESLGDLARRKDVKSLERKSADEVDKPIRLLIGYEEGKREEVENSLREAGYQIEEHSERARYFVVMGKDNAVEDDQGKIIKARMVDALFGPVQASGASSVTPNYQIQVPEPQAPGRRPQSQKEAARGSAATTPDDPLFNQLWGLHHVQAPMAWDVVTGSEVIVAVIDTGVDVNHEDLRENVWVNQKELDGQAGVDDDGNGYVDDINGWDFHNNDSSVYDSEADDHGTHVAGTIGAVQNQVGVVGLNWRVKIMPVKFLGPGGGSLNDAVKAIYYATDNGAEILNNSWGGGGYSPVLEQAIKEAGLFIAAAGNDTNDNDSVPSYPASYDSDNVIAVGSIDQDEKQSYFSNFGKKSVDLAAPGGLIVSTFPEDAYGEMSGTSMATPHVTGALALMRGSAWSSASLLDLKKELLINVKKLDSLANKCQSGGTLNVRFLSDVTCPPATGNANLVTAFTTFKAGDRTIVESGGPIAEIELELSGSAEVFIVANTSARSEDGGMIDTALSVDSGPNATAYRYVTCPANAWTGVTINHGLRLPAGKHRIVWDGYSQAGNVDLDDGALTVVARVEASGQTAERTTDRAKTGAAEDSPAQREAGARVEVRRREPGANSRNFSERREQRRDREAAPASKERRELRERTRRTLEDMPEIDE